MTWYQTGSVAVTNGETAVIGTGTAWVANVAAGMGITLPDGRLYEIAAVVSDTQITLAVGYLGATASAQPYTTVPTRGPELRLVQEVTEMVAQYGAAFLGAGQGRFADGTLAMPGLRFTADENTGFFRPGNEQIAAVTNGVLRWRLSNAGFEVNVPMTGTAITQSATDTTEGRLRKVGDFGLFPDGSSAAPAISFAADQDSGFYRRGENEVALATGGADRIRVTNSGVEILGPLAAQMQDLSGVTAQALHRSPNAITSMFIYDTSKDSDSGAWTERCQHTSWWNEPINGKWLGPQASETAARAVSGATTGDYFQLTTDGRFYSLNAGSGITEVFRGNKRDVPRLAGIVAEAGNVTIYDLTERGVNGSFPMWMRFAYTGMVGNISSNSMLNGVLCTANDSVASFSIIQWDFAGDASRIWYSAGNKYGVGGIAGRLSWLTAFPGPYTGAATASGAANAVAMTVLPNAPVDPVTGLRVPTIAVATGGGVSVIRHDGSVTTPSSIAGSNVSFDARNSVVHSFGENNRNYRKSYPPYTTSVTFIGGPLAFNGSVATLSGAVPLNRHTGKTLALGRSAGSYVALIRDNDRTPGATLASSITPTFNTGWMTGDIRRCFLSDTEVGSVTGPELVTNGTFDVDASGWTPSSANVTAARNASGQLEVTNNGAGWVSQTINTVAGKAYRVEVNWSQKQGAGRFNIGTTVGGSALLSVSIAGNYTGTAGLMFVAHGTTAVISLGSSSGDVGTVQIYDNISVREFVADRSYRNGAAFITGTLTRAQLASGTSLVGYSGFSAASYLREPYSADLNFGTGEWTGSAWLNIPTSVSASAVIFERAAASGASIRFGITATGQLTATAFDGTTTRTVTTSAAYNTAQWLKARVNYTTDGTLAILVNGREVAATRGAPLLTLNNASAVLTIGNSFALDAPFPGSIALLKLGATVPTPEQATFMFEQEKQLFRAGALCVLPDSGAIVDMAYDDATDRWVAVSETNESYWTGLVRNSVQAVPAGSFSRVVAGSGLELAARTGTNPGVDVTIPAYGLREELVRRAEAAARLSRELVAFDFVGGFTASTTNGSAAITNVAGLTYPGTLIGARVSGAGIPANTRIVGVSGTTIYLSAVCTATATGVSVSFLDFNLPVAFEARAVLSAGALRREGSTADYTRLYDGFLETIRFAVAPGATAWVQIQATRGAMQ